MRVGQWAYDHIEPYRAALATWLTADAHLITTGAHVIPPRAAPRSHRDTRTGITVSVPKANRRPWREKLSDIEGIGADYPTVTPSPTANRDKVRTWDIGCNGT
ncbi:hypothetical protein Saa2_09404 [Streptomyces acidiscabies]|nr:hypothetical protein Saa2_09404 [Streptomyces acidiscabies]